MSGRKPWTDTTDYISSRVPLRRKVDLEFDRVQNIDGHFRFWLRGDYICSVAHRQFTQKQIDFFDGISETAIE